jgi:CubicO group peptidase (beta-lactamase class C family)
MHRTATRFGLIVAVAVLAAAKVAAQQAPSGAGPHLQPNAGGEAAAVKRVVDGIMQPYLAQGQRRLRGHLWSRSPYLGAIVAVSLHGHRYFFPYGKATDAGAPFTSDTLVEIGSCTKTFTTTLFVLAVNRNQIVPDAFAQKCMPEGYTLRAQQLTPLELADFTSGMPDDPTNLPRGLEQRSIEHYTVKDFLTWASNYEPTTRLPAPYRYSNAGIGLLSYLVATATGKTWEDQVNSEILQPLGMADTTLRPTPEQQKRLAQGHNRAGRDAQRWPVYAWYAAGGLRSTAQDMISFGEANLGHEEMNGKDGRVLGWINRDHGRFKKEIRPMDKASEAILAFKPVTFHYKSDTTNTPQFGLIAEEVAKVNPDLVVRDKNGEIYTVRYDAVNAMLLNEFLKEHRKNEEQEATIARQQKQIEVLTADLQKVSDQLAAASPSGGGLEANKPTPQVVAINQ